jgi:uncharacterized protein with GYD domain
MPDYVMLMSLTEQGAREIAKAPERIELAQRMWSDLGGKLKSFHVTLDAESVLGRRSAMGDRRTR